MRVSEDGMHINQKKNEGQYHGPNEQFNKIACAISSVFTCCFYRKYIFWQERMTANYINEGV